MIKKHRSVVFYKTYFQEFFLKQPVKVRDKIIWTFTLLEELERIPEMYLKHIEGSNGLFEIRIQQGSNIFRIFCFFEKDKLIVVANGFQKKSQKLLNKKLRKH